MTSGSDLPEQGNPTNANGTRAAGHLSAARLQSCNPADGEAAGSAEGCPELARSVRILDHAAAALEGAMVVGEKRTIQLLYLVVTSRLLARPVSVVVKGPSAAGKSFLVEQVLGLFPSEAHYQLTAMSEKALAYSQEPLRHRVLVLYEAVSLRSDFASYLVRSLLSEGRVRYETVERTAKGLRPRLIERAGPTGLITTTTALQLHPENETRMLSLTVADTPAQTAAVMLATASDARSINVVPFHDLQRWLADQAASVIVPYARTLAALIPPVAVRLRRDFRTLLALIETHALLHRATRQHNERGTVVAALEDYAVVRDLIADLVAEGVKAAVPITTRETVEAVRALSWSSPDEGISVAVVARQLGLDESSAYRRVRAAIERGYLRNLEDRPRRPARLVMADELPEELPVLPTPDRLQDCIAAGPGAEEPGAGDAK